MKLMMIIMQSSDVDVIVNALTENAFRVTHIASTGGFLRRGMSTLIVGVEDEKVDEAIQILRFNLSPELDPSMRRATIFVLPVEEFHQV